MSWNFRVIKLNVMGEDLYKLAEVYYDDNNKPNAWSEPFLEGLSVEEIQEVLDRCIQGAAKPVIDVVEMTEYKLHEKRPE